TYIHTLSLHDALPIFEGTFFHLSAKFGAKPEDAARLLRKASAHGCQVGLAFHVGSQCLVPSAYRNALGLVGEIMEAAQTPLHMRSEEHTSELQSRFDL